MKYEGFFNGRNEWAGSAGVYDTEQEALESAKKQLQNEAGFVYANEVSDPTVDMSPFGAALFNCLKSPNVNDQLAALDKLQGEL